MKKINKLIIAFTLLILCSGCSINYNIEITANTVKETIKVNDTITSNRSKNDILNEYQSWFPAYIDDENNATDYDSSKKIDAFEYHEKAIKELNNGYYYTYEFNYPINKYSNATSTREAYSKRKFYIGKDYIIINTDKENLLCNYSYFEDLTITISVDKDTYKVNYSNAHITKGNQYIWNIDRNNCDNSEIVLKLDIIDKDIDKENNQQSSNNNNPNDNTTNKDKFNINNYIIYIFLAILALIVYMGYNWFRELKEKNNNID